MSESVDVHSGGLKFTAELDFETGRWSTQAEYPEGDFPFVVNHEGNRYELYSDNTFAEVEE